MILKKGVKQEWQLQGKRLTRRKFLAAAGAVLMAAALTSCSPVTNPTLVPLPTATISPTNTVTPSPSATVTPIPETATPSPTPKPTETPTIEPTATKEVMTIQVEGLTPESREDIAEGKLELDPKVAQEVYKSLWTAFLNDGWVNGEYFNKYFPGSLSNYPEFMRQLKKKDYQMPAGLKIPRPVGYDYHDAIPFELGTFKTDTIVFDLWTIPQTEARMALPDGDPRKLGRDEILSGTTPAGDTHTLKLITGEDGITRLQLILASGGSDDYPQWVKFVRMNGTEFTPEARAMLGNWMGLFPVVIKGMKNSEASFIYGSNIKYTVVGCYLKPKVSDCHKQNQDPSEQYDLFGTDLKKMVFTGLFKLTGSGN